MHRPHGAGILAHQIVKFRRSTTDVVLLFNGPETEPVGLLESVLVITHRIDGEGHLADMGFPAAANRQGKLVGSGSGVLPGLQGDVGSRHAVFGGNDPIGGGLHAVVDPEGGLADGIVRAGFGKDDHCTALIHAVSGVVLHRDIQHFIEICPHRIRLHGYGDGLIRLNQQLDAHALVCRRGKAQLFGRFSQRGVRKEKFLFVCKIAFHTHSPLDEKTGHRLAPMPRFPYGITSRQH